MLLSFFPLPPPNVHDGVKHVMCCDKRYLFSLLQVDDQGGRLGKRRRQFPNSSRQHLKVVELHGFLGVSLILKLRLTCCKLQ